MSRNSAELVLLSIVFFARRDDFHIAPSVSGLVFITLLWAEGPLRQVGNLPRIAASRKRYPCSRIPRRRGKEIMDCSTSSCSFRIVSEGPVTSGGLNREPSLCKSHSLLVMMHHDVYLLGEPTMFYKTFVVITLFLAF